MSFNITVEGGTSVRLPTAGKYCDRDIIVTATGCGGGAEPVIEPLEITENGTYTAPDGVDGYSPVTVNVPTGGGGENLDKLIEGTLTEVSSAVTSIGDYVFYQYKKLESVDFPNVIRIGNYAFSKCNKLASVDFQNATHIGEYAFSECNKLVSADFPNVTSIGANSFYRCYNLASVDFPKATAILANAFNSAHSLKTIILRKNAMCGLAHTNAFNGCYHLHGFKNATYNPNGDKDCYIYVPRDLVDSYKFGSNWSTFASQFRAIEDYPEITGG